MSTVLSNTAIELSSRWATAEEEVARAVQSITSGVADLPHGPRLSGRLGRIARACNTSMRGALFSLGRVDDLAKLSTAANEMSGYALKLDNLNKSIDEIDLTSRDQSSWAAVQPSVWRLRSVIDTQVRPIERDAAEVWLELYTQHRYGLPIARDTSRDTVTGWESVVKLSVLCKGELGICNHLSEMWLTRLRDAIHHERRIARQDLGAGQ